MTADETPQTAADIVANWPPLTPAQLDRLAVLLRTDGQAASVAGDTEPMHQAS
jgi:hypothetical protein